MAASAGPGTPVDIGVAVLPSGQGLPLPSRATPGSSGVDLLAAVDRDVQMDPGGRALVPTGICVSIPAGFEWQIRPRSGLAVKQGLTVLNSPGTVDSDYRGEVCVVLVNLGDRPVTVSRGDRIAQAVLCRVETPRLVPVPELPPTGRNDGGFGSTGI